MIGPKQWLVGSVLLNYDLSNSKEHNPSSETNTRLASHIFPKLEILLPYLDSILRATQISPHFITIFI
jgi:hypothetical protein